MFIILSWIFLMGYLAVLNIVTQQLNMTPNPPKMIYNPSEMQLLLYGIGLVLLEYYLTYKTSTPLDTLN